MNDQQGLDQQAIDDLLADASKSLPGLTPPEGDNTEPEVPPVSDELVSPPPEETAPQTALPAKNKFILFFKTLKQQITKKQVLTVVSLFLLVIGGSAFLGYKMTLQRITHLDPLEKIVQRGINFEEKNFVIYAGYGDKNIVNAFLDTGMSVDSLRATDGWSPLIAAAFYKKPEVVKILLEKEATVNLQDKYGKTALMQASAMGAEDIVTMLLNHGANPNLQDMNGRTALMEAYSKNQSKIAELLKAAGANPNIQPIKKSANPVIPPVTPKDLPVAALPPGTNEESRLTVGKAGFVQIGMPLAEIQKKYPTVTLNQRYVNGVKKSVATVYLSGPDNPSLELELSNSNLKLVSTISAFDEKFSTDKQISIKSTVGEIRNQYSISDVKVIDNSLYLLVRSMRMLFELDIRREEILNEWLNTGNASAIPGDVKVKKIIIY